MTAFIPPAATDDSAMRAVPIPLRSAVAGFSLDAAIAVGSLLFLSLLTGMVWAAIRGVQFALQEGGDMSAEGLIGYLGQPSGVAMLWMTLLSTGGAALVLYWFRHRATALERGLSLRLALRGSTWGWALLAAITTFVFSTVLGGLAQYHGIAPQPTNQAIIQEVFAHHPVFLVLFAVVIAPAYEELLFRRVLFGRLWAAGRPWLGLVLSSAAFALMHELPVLNGNSWSATLVLWLTYGFMGAVFAAVYWRTRTLWAAYAAHVLNNAVALAVMKLYGGA